MTPAIPHAVPATPAITPTDADDRGEPWLRRQQAAMLASVSHELLTPLTVLCATAETLSEMSDDPMVLRLAEAQGRAATSLRTMIEEVLTVGRLLSHDDRSDDHEHLDLEAYLRRAHEATAAERAYGLHLAIDESARHVRSSPDLLNLLFRCLLDDRAASGGDADVTVAASIADDHLVLTVASVDPQSMDADGEAFHPSGGAGLPMVSATLIAERLGGTLEVERGGAQRATVRLPQRRAEDRLLP